MPLTLVRLPAGHAGSLCTQPASSTSRSSLAFSWEKTAESKTGFQPFPPHPSYTHTGLTKQVPEFVCSAKVSAPVPGWTPKHILIWQSEHHFCSSHWHPWGTAKDRLAEEPPLLLITFTSGFKTTLSEGYAWLGVLGLECFPYCFLSWIITHQHQSVLGPETHDRTCSVSKLTHVEVF